MSNTRLKGGAIQLTHIEGEISALLTVRGKDHDLGPSEMRVLAAALASAAGDNTATSRSAAFCLEQLEAELDTLWRVMFGDVPRPSNSRRALARCWAAAMTVDWEYRAREFPLGVVRDEEADS